MSQKNVAAFKRAIEALNRRDMDAVLEKVDPEVEAHFSLEVRLGGEAVVHRGHEGLREAFQTFSDAFAGFHYEFSDIRDLGDRVVAIGRLSTRGRESGAEAESTIAYVVDFKDGKTIRIRSYLDPNDALGAAGVRGLAMSQENVDVVRRSYDLNNEVGKTGAEFVDPEEIAPDFWARLAPDFELHDRSELPDARVYRGPDEAKEFWRKTQQVFAEIRWEPQEFIDLGHAVVVETTVRAVGRGSEVWTEMPETDVFWFRDGMIVRLQGFATKKEALEAAGLAE